MIDLLDLVSRALMASTGSPVGYYILMMLFGLVGFAAGSGGVCTLYVAMKPNILVCPALNRSLRNPQRQVFQSRCYGHQLTVTVITDSDFYHGHPPH